MAEKSKEDAPKKDASKFARKKFCKLKSSDYEKKGYRKLIKKPLYYCSKCGRVSKNKSNLCKAVKLDD